MISLMLACGWLILANLIGLFPSRWSHWPQAYGLMLVGVPLLGYVYVENGAWVAALVLVAGLSILRWPVRYLVRWVRRRLGDKEAGL